MNPYYLKKYSSFPSIRGAFSLSVALILIMSALASCSSIGLAPAKTFNDRLTYSYTSHKIASELAISAAQSGKISKDRAKKIEAELSKALVDLEMIEIMKNAGQGDTALVKLASVNKILLMLRAEMGEKE